MHSEVEELASPSTGQGRALVWQTRRRLFGALIVSNLIGIAIVVACIAWVLPGPEVDVTRRMVVTNLVLGALFLFLVVPGAVVWGEAWLRSGRRWIQEGRTPTDAEVTAVLRSPLRLFLVHLSAWLVAAALFSIANGLMAPGLIARMLLTISLGGLTTSAFSYLAAERITRPLAITALARRGVERPKLPGITTRTMIAWSLGTGVPLLGVLLTGLLTLIDPDATVTQLAVTMVVLAATGLIVGAAISAIGARAVADPITSLRQGMGRLARGDLSARIEVSDGSVLGLLQSGFNEMAEGLQERERLRDLYGRQVGEDVARAALDRGTELGGETRLVAVLFVDVVASTYLAATRPPEEVVSLLNRFFGTVVDEVHRHGGWINKFQGDATLAVFGAPTDLDDPAGRALAAARGLATRLPREIPELAAGVGVAHGPAVAGNVGEERRFEFTVIGDPVNEAARLTELAKQHQPMVLASAAAWQAAGPEEKQRWELDGEVQLRGRTDSTRLARPVP